MPAGMEHAVQPGELSVGRLILSKALSDSRLAASRSISILDLATHVESRAAIRMMGRVSRMACVLLRPDRDAPRPAAGGDDAPRRRVLA